MIKNVYRLQYEIDQWAEIYFLEGEEYNYLLHLYPQEATIQRTNDTLEVYGKVITGYTALSPHWDYYNSRQQRYYSLENRMQTPLALEIHEHLEFIRLHQSDDYLLHVKRQDTEKGLGVNITSVSEHYDYIATQFYQVLMRGEKYDD